MTSGKYELRKVTPNDCFGGLGCPAVYVTSEKPDTYLVVGKKVDPQETGLAAKVGEDEQVIAVPKSLLDKLKK